MIVRTLSTQSAAKLAALGAAFFLMGQTRLHGQLAPQPQISFTAGSAGTWNADWQGVAHRVYFMQWSVDLVTWTFCPFMNFGAALHSRGCNSSSDKFFIRLVYYDDPSIDDLQEAQNADLDGDGVSNLDEVKILGTNPALFSTNGSGVGDGERDLDGDGMDDRFELLVIKANAGDALEKLEDVLPADDFDGDGIKNFDEARYGLNALGDDPANTAAQVQYEYDFDALTGANFQTGVSASYGYDSNGNPENVSE